MENEIKAITYKNGIKYKYKNSRIFIEEEKEDKDIFKITTYTFTICTDEEKEEYKLWESPYQALIQREHSKYCVFINRMRLSKNALSCFTDYTLNRIKHKVIR